jgi:hypothetical protein
MLLYVCAIPLLGRRTYEGRWTKYKKIFKRERKQIELEFFHNSAKTFLNKQIIEAEVDDVVEE